MGGLPVTTVASGGLAVSDTGGGGPLGLCVTEVAKGGLAITKVAAGKGMGVVFVTQAGVIVPPVPPVTYVTLDPATVAAVTLSGGNLVATSTGTSSPDQGARVADAAAKTTGKYYFECVTTLGTSGINIGVGVATIASTYTGMGNSGTTGVIVFHAGNIYSNGSFTGLNTGTLSTTCSAVDFDNRRAWFRGTAAGNWNGSGTANPATNTGGVVVPAGMLAPILTFGGTGGFSGNIRTLNFGASAFSGAVPAGFTSGWPT